MTINKLTATDSIYAISLKLKRLSSHQKRGALFMESLVKHRYFPPILAILATGCSSPQTRYSPQVLQEQHTAIVAYFAPATPGPTLPPIPPESRNLVARVQAYLTEKNIASELRPVMDNGCGTPLYAASLLPRPHQLKKLQGGVYVCSPQPLPSEAAHYILPLLPKYGPNAGAYRASLNNKNVLSLEAIH